MPLIDYKPEALTHPNSADRRVAPLMAGRLHFPVAGPQVIPATIWNEAIKSQEYGEKLSEYLSRGVLTILEKDSENPTLKDETPSKAVALIKECFDIKLLEAWQADEARPTVIKALELKIKELTPPPAKEKA